MQKIAIVIPYFGQLPAYFNFYINSLKNIPYIDILFYTDINITQEVPSNFKVISTSLESLSRKIDSRLNIHSQINHPIKLCDFKPTYGDVFQHDLEPYSHWGFGDIDIIYGDITSFLPNNWQQKDIISFLPNWLSGSLCILKNSPEMCHLYQKSQHWQEILESSEHKAFDECHHYYSALKNGANIFDIDDKQSFTWVVKKYELEGKIDAYFSESVIKEKLYVGESIQVTNNTITLNNGRQFAYYHLICEKKLLSFKLPSHKIPDNYTIDRQGFHYNDDYQSSLYKILQSSIGAGQYLIQQLIRIKKRV
ncbi:hypothetical protein RCJ22_23865, partial [Vibrio sp. FNV 38]|nr:hypothetical protein [Vibrio sp. FNV 38]